MLPFKNQKENHCKISIYNVGRKLKTGEKSILIYMSASSFELKIIFRFFFQ